MTTDAGVDRAVVHAGAAADALQRLPQLLVGVGLRAAVVDQHQMHFLRSVLLALAARAGDHVEVGGDRLAGGRARQQAVQRHHVFELLDHLLDAGDRDMHVRHRRAHAAVAFVLDQAQATGFGDGEVHAGEADVGIHEFFAQHITSDLDQRIDILGVGHARHLLCEQFGDVLLGLVDRRHDDVRGLLTGQLDDVFAHVRLQRFDAGGVHGVVQLDFLADHRLAFHHQPGVVLVADAEDDGVGLIRAFRPVHLNAVLDQIGFQLLEQGRQARQAVAADFLGQRALAFQQFRVGELRGALGDQEIHGAAEALAQERIGHHLGGAALEFGAGNKLHRLRGHSWPFENAEPPRHQGTKVAPRKAEEAS